MARTRAAGYDAQRQAILETAAQAFAEVGFPSASMNDIARRCGVSKGLLYHYYASKEQLLFDLTSQYTRRLVEIVAETEARHPAAPARLPALIRALVDEYQTSQSRHVVLLHDVRFLAPAERGALVADQRRVVAAFETAIAAAFGLPLESPALKPMTMMLFGMMNWTFTWLKPAEDAPAGATRPRISYGDYAEMVATAFAAGVGALAGAGAAPPRLNVPAEPPPSA